MMARSLTMLLVMLGICGVTIGCTSTSHRPHRDHSHDHASDCGHVAIRHASHVDYLHDGHLHHIHGDHVDDHAIPVSKENPDGCTEQLNDHQHGDDCGHDSIPHGDHHDYVVDSRLHHSHDGHCDDHGMIEIAN